MHFLITGGLGFIGSNLVDHLVAEYPDCHITVLDNESTGHNLCILEHSQVSYINGDITDETDLAKIPATITHCVHLAAAISVVESVADPDKYERTNVGGSAKLLKALKDRCPDLQKVCGASSAAIYGDCPVPTDGIDESLPYGGVSPYADTKFRMESLLREFYNTTHIATCSFRFFNVFGPRQDPSSPYTGVVSIFIDRAKDGKPLTIFGDGNQTRDFIYVGDLCKAIDLFLTSEPHPYDVYNLGTGSRTSITDLAQTIVTVCQSESSIGYDAPRVGDIIHSRSNPTKFQTAFKWEAKTPLDEGLRAIVQSLSA